MDDAKLQTWKLQKQKEAEKWLRRRNLQEHSDVHLRSRKLRGHPKVHWDAINEMVDSLPPPLGELSWRRRARLYWRLCEARHYYDFRRDTRRAISGKSTSKSIVKKLGRIEGSLKRIGDWAEADDPAVAAAINELKNLGDGWLPFSVTGFFEAALDVHMLVRHARSRLKLKHDPEPNKLAAVSVCMPPERWLIGKDLPKIYELVFGDKFSINTWENVDHRIPGNEFILEALAVMDIWPNGKRGEEWSLETIKSHCRLAARPLVGRTVMIQ